MTKSDKGDGDGDERESAPAEPQSVVAVGLTAPHAQQGAAAAGCSSHGATPRPSRVASRASSRSSATIVALQLEARAQHARRLADLEKERERQAAERERQVAELELQANLAAIEAGGSQGSRGTRSRASIQEWVNNTMYNPNAQHLLSANPPFRSVDIAAQRESLGPREPHGMGAAATKNSHEQNRTEDGGMTRLVNSLDKLINKVNQTKTELPTFDGKSYLDWLALKRVYENQVDSFSATENLARLSRALRGTAREAVAGLLAAARDPSAVVAALDARFGRAELVVMNEVAAVRALPKLSYDGKDLVIFASRIRNCVEVIRMLNKPDHLRSPDLFQTIWGKLPPLLRPRWLDYAHSCNSDESKIEMLADFLSREVDLQCKFGGVFDQAPVIVSRWAGNRDKVNIVTENKHSFDIIPPTLNSHKNFDNNCSFCKQNHDISDCNKFVKLSTNDRWQFIKKNKICHRCLKKGFHRNKISCMKRVCSVEGCQMRHHVLLHGSKLEHAVTAHVDVGDDDEDDDAADVEQVQSTSGVYAPATRSVPKAPATTLLSDDSEHEILTHATASSSKEPSVRPLLKIVAVTVSGPSGSVDTFALLDDGASGTFIDSEISTRIGAKAPEKQIHLDCVVGLGKDVKVQYIDFNIKGRHTTEVHSIKKARAIKGLGAARQCPHHDSVRKYPYLADIADLFCYGDVKPMVIIGLDNWHLSLARHTRIGTRTQPAAILTALGWVLFGFGCSKTKRVEVVNYISVDEPNFEIDRFTVEQLIREQYKIDSIGISKYETRNTDDERALQVLEQTAHRLPGGRFEVGLLWKADNLDIPNSYKLALSRFLSLEKKMSKDPYYAERYRHNIHDMLSKGYAEPCSPSATADRPTWYLPHFGVINPNKPAKLRTVHDAAAKSHGVSLNSLLLTGPDLLQPLLGILMRFREGAIALNADIREMFPQVKIIDKDRDAQRFLWRDTPAEPIKTYRMSSMIFGAASSPCTAIHIKNKNALEFQDIYPDAARVIINDHYMDDCITSLDDVRTAARLAADIYTVHAHAGFEMRCWTSNNPNALSALPKECLLEVPQANNDVELGRLATPVRTLGLIWQPANDEIGFNTGVKKDAMLPEKLTKREVLVHVMRIYDPLGILAPIVVRGRIMFQDAWRKGLDWNQELSQYDNAAWKLWYQDLIYTSNLRIPRRYNLSDHEVVGCELHLFSDASESAYAAVAYWRFLYVNGDIKLALICSKVRVSPLRPISIPRLELQGALIAARLATSICEAHRLKPLRRIFWCDSMTALGWLRSDARTLKPFVSHRVGEILELTDISEWRWVPSDLNVADDATRAKRTVLSTESRWVSGPAFLLSCDWPTEPQIDISGLGREEYKHFVHLINETHLPAPISANPSRFSSWLRLVRATAKAHQFISLLRMRSMKRRDANFRLPRHEGLLCTFDPTCTSSPGTPNFPNISSRVTASDIRLAETHILRQSQLDCFKEDILRIKNRDPLPKSSRLYKLSPFIDSYNKLRMSSRIVAAMAISDEVKRPLILDGKHPAVRLLIARYHQKAGHANKEQVLNELHQRFWIIGLRNAIRSVAHDCQLCKLRRARTFQPPMGNLPDSRLAHHQRPFSFVGLDYFGPVLISIGRRREKRYVALFTCLVIRAVHLEVAHSLSTDAAIMCLRRFIARRGTPLEIWSDNGTAFVGANRELRALYGDAIEDFAANESINWRFIPPAAPFMGGAWERLVRSIKEALKVTLREQAPPDEVLNTLLAEAEALVNTRPLTHVSLEPDAEEALTPAHFILTSSPGRPIPATLTEADLLSRSKWRRAVRLADHFWQRWVKEYLPSLSVRTGGGSPPNIAVGDVVIVCDSNLPRGSWPKGRVTTLYPGKDGIIRVADVTTAAGVLRRPLKKLAKVVVS